MCLIGGGGGIDGTAVHFVATRERQQLDERVIMCPLRWGSVLNLRRRRVDGNTLARTLLWDLYLPPGKRLLGVKF